MITEKMSEFITTMTYGRIPREAVAIAKKSLLDGVGVALAGSKERTGRIVVEYVKERDGKPESGVIGCGFKTDASLAALANGTMAHALDYDDHAITWTGHPTVVLLPPVFALAEKNGLSGQNILESYIVGWEVGSRICNELSSQLLKHGWHPTATAGTLAATAACARLLRLNAQQTKTALGIAASEASGLRHNFGTDTKPFHAGQAASNAIMAILLAQKGFTASETVLEGPTGFCNVFARKECDPSAVTQSLGKTFDIITSAAIKPYPSCGLTHRCIDGMLYLVNEHQFLPDQVASVECHTPALFRNILAYSRPQTGLEGKFSMEYCMAAALIDREVRLSQFTDSKVQSPKAQDFLRKVQFVPLEEVEGENLLSIPQAVRVKLQDGTEYSHKVLKPKGYPNNPMSWEEVAEKFQECAQGVLTTEKMEKAIALLSKLESLESIGELMAVVC